MDGNAITLRSELTPCAKAGALWWYARNQSCMPSYPEDVLTCFEAFVSWADDAGLLDDVVTVDPDDLNLAGKLAWEAFECAWDSLAAQEVR